MSKNLEYEKKVKWLHGWGYVDPETGELKTHLFKEKTMDSDPRTDSMKYYEEGEINNLNQSPPEIAHLTEDGDFVAKEVDETEHSGGCITEQGHQAGIDEWLANGGAVLEPYPRELFIDVDSMSQDDDFQDAFTHMKMNCYPDARIIYMGKSRNHTGKKWFSRHYIIDLGFNTDIWTKVALQAMLRSDHRKEIISLGRIINGITNPSLFFETQEAADEIERARRRAYGNTR